MIRLKNENDLKFLRESGRILVEVLMTLKKEAKVGVHLKDLDDYAYFLIKKAGAQPAFLGYQPSGAKKPYPATICTSLNDQIVHGLPSDSSLKEGDVLKIDLGVNYQGYFTDAALTVGIGKISKEAQKLIKVTENALNKAIKICKPNNRLGDIGWIIEREAKRNNLKVIKSLTGHGVGFQLHEEPTVYNYGQKGEGILLEPGLVLAIEPMFSLKSEQVRQLDDESYATFDGSLSAHFEKTVFITETGPEVLTLF